MAFDAFDRLARFRDPASLRSGIHCSKLLEAANAIEQQKSLTPEDRFRWSEARSALKTRSAHWAAIVASAGVRYEKSSLSNYEVLSAGHEAAVQAVKRYLRSLTSGEAGNLVFIGPPGTGKDHLMMAVVRHAVIGLGMASAWTDGQMFFSAVRDAYSTDQTETPLVNFACRSEVLAISDPLPSNGAITEHQRNVLSRVIDGRYRWHRPLLATLNVATFEELRDRLGDSLADRLCNTRESPAATIVPCNWPSYRRTVHLSTAS